MKSLVTRGAVALMVLSTAAFLPAQTGVQPGQLASSPAIATPLADLAPGTNSSAVTRETSIANVQDKHDRTMNRVWVISILAMAAGTSLDSASSWGKEETNSFLASSNGNFGAKGVILKASFGAAVIIPQILLRKHRNLLVPFAVGNFAEAAVFGAVAIHNLGVSSPQN